MSLARNPTVFACGARIRNTIRWSGETSGETTLTGACIAGGGVGGALCGFASCARPTTAATEQAKAMAAIQNVRFISASPLQSWGTRAAWEAPQAEGLPHYGASQRPDSAERNSASMTAMFLMEIGRAHV